MISNIQQILNSIYWFHPLTQNETWLFTPPNDQNAVTRNGKVYTHDQTIVPATNGKIEQILNSNDPRILARKNESLM